jgi:hypothetical protein
MAWGGARRWPGASGGGGASGALASSIWRGRRISAHLAGAAGLEQQRPGARAEEYGVEREHTRGSGEEGEQRGNERGASDPCWSRASRGDAGGILGRVEPCRGAKLDSSFSLGQG